MGKVDDLLSMGVGGGGGGAFSAAFFAATAAASLAFVRAIEITLNST